MSQKVLTAATAPPPRGVQPCDSRGPCLRRRGVLHLAVMTSTESLLAWLQCFHSWGGSHSTLLLQLLCGPQRSALEAAEPCVSCFPSLPSHAELPLLEPIWSSGKRLGAFEVMGQFGISAGGRWGGGFKGIRAAQTVGCLDL